MNPMNPSDLVLRAATPRDLAAFERFAAASAIGITTLPANRAALLDRLERSQQAFNSADDSSGEEIYLFVLEDSVNGAIVGTSGIAASAGFADRFYSYRNEMVVHASQALGVSNRIHTLHLCHDLTGHTLLTSFFIDPAYENSLAPQLLSRARLLFIAEFAERFSDRIAAESPGLADDTGRCPFWDAVGRRFFDMDYPAAEQLTGGRNKAFIAELLPPAPIYVPLLPEAAQWAIGQLHPVAELPFAILLDEGFDTETYVDIFDGGPTVDARVSMLKTVARSRRATLRTLSAPATGAARDADAAAAADTPGWLLLSSTLRSDFRAVLVRGPGLDAQGFVAVDAGVAERLHADAGERLRVAPLHIGSEP
jgi:arginine N-succinyltransferase